MIKIVKAIRTCYACPEQWDCTTDDGREVYIRSRWGKLTASFGTRGAKIVGIDVNEAEILNFSGLKTILQPWMEFQCEEINKTGHDDLE